MVQFGKQWEINSLEDYMAALATLKTWDFFAEMSDDFSVWRSEKEEIARQKFNIEQQRQTKGIE